MYYTVRVWGAISTDFISRSDLSAQRSVSFTRRWRRPRWKPPSIYTGNEALAVISAHASSRLFFSFLSSLFFISLFLSCSILFFFPLWNFYIYPCVYIPADGFFSFFFSSACPPPLVGKKPRRSRHHYYATTTFGIFFFFFSLPWGLYNNELRSCFIDELQCVQSLQHAGPRRGLFFSLCWSWSIHVTRRLVFFLLEPKREK